jgi:hypothetical protein
VPVCFRSGCTSELSPGEHRAMGPWMRTGVGVLPTGFEPVRFSPYSVAPIERLDPSLRYERNPVAVPACRAPRPGPSPFSFRQPDSLPKGRCSPGGPCRDRSSARAGEPTLFCENERCPQYPPEDDPVTSDSRDLT